MESWPSDMRPSWELMRILTDNDFHALQTALQRMDELTLTRSLVACGNGCAGAEQNGAD